MLILMHTGPSALTVNIIKNIESSSIVVQWDAADDSLTTTYTIIWTRAGGGAPQIATVIEQTSYTINGLALDTVYTITVAAANPCGSAPEFSTSIILATVTTSTTFIISSYVVASANPTIIISTVNPSSTATTFMTSSKNSITSTITTISAPIIVTNLTTIGKPIKYVTGSAKTLHVCIFYT